MVPTIPFLYPNIRQTFLTVPSSFPLDFYPVPPAHVSMQGHVSVHLSSGEADPLLIHPPISETVEERNVRLAIEGRAKAVSDGIDEELEKVRALEWKGPKPIKLLLLGIESESILTENTVLLTLTWEFFCRPKRVRCVQLFTENCIDLQRHF